MDLVQSRVFSRYENVVFGMSTRYGGVNAPPYYFNLSMSVGDNPDDVRHHRALFFGTLGIPTNRLVFPLQVHSARVQTVSNPGRYEATDGVATDKKDLYLVVTVADCAPVFMYAPRQDVIAAVHAGWRGTIQNIGGRMIDLLRQEWAVPPAELTVFIGPSAGPCCYEVGEEVARLFDPSFVEEVGGGKYMVDVAGMNKRQVIDAGVLPANIEHLHECTICSPDRYHSYRRDGTLSGRMMAVIGLRSKL